MTTIKQTDRDAALVGELRYTHEWGIFQAQEDAMLPSFEECADRIESLSAEVERLREMVEYLGQELQKYRANYMVGTSAALEATE